MRNIFIVSDTHFGHSNILKFTGSDGALILGNHDNGKASYLQNSFEKILMWRMFPEFNCVLTHVPIHESGMYKVHYNLHGHIHQNPSPTDRHINCSVEVQNYTPRCIEELIP